VPSWFVTDAKNNEQAESAAGQLCDAPTTALDDTHNLYFATMA
jgi:hypothetical protein